MSRRRGREQLQKFLCCDCNAELTKWDAKYCTGNPHHKLLNGERPSPSKLTEVDRHRDDDGDNGDEIQTLTAAGQGLIALSAFYHKLTQEQETDVVID